MYDMKSRKKRRKKNNSDYIRNIFLKILYLICFTSIVAGTVYIYVVWYERYSAARPPLASAEGSFYVDEVPLRAILIWNEEVLYAPREGKVFYPKGEGPFFAGKNDLLAIVESDFGSKLEIRANEPGYFIAGVDGYEGQWNYINLWNNSVVSTNKKLRLMKNGTVVQKGSAVGKLIPHPQRLRAIAYAGYFPSLNNLARDRKANIKMRKDSFPINADIEAIGQSGSLVKMYLALPFFPLEYVYSREANLFLCMGEKMGVVVPESAVLMRDGKLWVYKVEGDEVFRQQIDGLPLGKGKFMVTKGLKPGEVVVKDISKAREGVIRLW